MTKVNHALKLLAIIASVFFIGYFLESYSYFSPLASNYFEISTELLPLVLSFSIFVMTWHAYTKNRDNNSLFLGAAFLIIGVFDLYHMISKPFMPDFITHNSPQKAAVFWIGARLISALLFLASAFIFEDSVPRLINKPVLFVSVNVLSIVFLLTVLRNPEYLNTIQYLDGSLVFSSSVVISYASYMYSRRFRETGQKNIVCLIYGFVIIISSNLFYFSSDYSGYLLRAAGYYFIYLGLFKSSIEQPYEKRVVTEENLRYEVEEKYRSIFENASDAIITIDLENRITSWNTSAENMFGWTAQEVIGKDVSQLIVPQDLLTEREIFIHDTKSGRTVAGVETVRQRKDGTKIDVSLTISPIIDTNQNIVGLSGIIRDISERKRSDEQIKQSLKEKEILLREIHHRVKNNMQVVSSLLKLQSGYITEEKYLEMFKESRNRIMSMSLVYEKFYKSEGLVKINFKEYIKDFIGELFQSYGIKKGTIALNINAEDISFGVDTAIPCGLIINELVTNSLKHAFPDERDGEIKIVLHRTDENTIELVVSDNGVGIPKDLDFKKTESLGLHLVTILVENQLQGSIGLDRSKGAEFQIKFKGGTNNG